MPVFDFNKQKEEKVSAEKSYELVYSSERESNASNPIMILEDKGGILKHHSDGMFEAPTKGTAFAYDNEEKTSLIVQNITMLSNKVIWLDMLETDQLRKMHNYLNKELNSKFNIPLSGFDGEKFQFHSTLFQELDENKKIVSC